MTIEVKYNPGETVYYMSNNKVSSDTIKGFKISAVYSGYSDDSWGGRTYPVLHYYLINQSPEVWLGSNQLFSSKEELLKSL